MGEYVEDVLQVGQSVEARIVNVNTETNKIDLTMRAPYVPQFNADGTEKEQEQQGGERKRAPRFRARGGMSDSFEDKKAQQPDDWQKYAAVDKADEGEGADDQILKLW